MIAACNIQQAKAIEQKAYTVFPTYNVRKDIYLAGQTPI